MIPVALRLQNFLSYGTAAPTLDFEQFRVACLSGRNGQGKSALLDAITWALWGEARKSSESRKPDDDLLRIGARRMQVELVFDLEGERYRVVRWYEKSKTGKTSKPGLEVHAYDPAQDAYRPLTGASMRETQQILNNLLGIDYDTFINSAFLLQGRSDEFTKKKPTERKQILARILNLGRYDRLADMARERVRAAEARLEVAGREAERLSEALAEEPAWKEEAVTVEAAIAEAEAALEAGREVVQRLTARQAALEARAREAETVRDHRERLEARRTAEAEERETLLARIREAEDLIARQDEIERAYQRFKTLKERYDALVEKQHLYHAIEKQVRQRESELKDRKTALEKRLHALEVEIRSARDEQRRCTHELAALPAARRGLERALEAREKLRALEAARERRRRLEEQRAAAEQALLKEEERLKARLTSLEAEVAREPDWAANRTALEAQKQAREQEVAAYQRLRERLEEVEREGKRLAEGIKEREGLVAAREEALREKEERLKELLALEEGACPTCGTPLTPAHREEVAARYRKALDEMREALRQDRAWIEKEEQRRLALRDRYRKLKAEVTTLEKAPEALATVLEKLAQAEEGGERVEARKQEIDALRRRLREADFGHEARKRLREIDQALAEEGFDEEAYEATKAEAMQHTRFENEVRRLEEVSGRMQQLERLLERKTAEAEGLRRGLDDGTELKPLLDQIAQLQQQLAETGFDHGQLEAVRQSLRAVEGAEKQQHELLHARANRAEWKEAVKRLDASLKEAEETTRTLEGQLATIEAELANRPALTQELQAQQEACAQIEARLGALRTRQGELNSRLEQATRDRKALRLRQKERAEAKQEKTLYDHLRKAFGKNGIPSLIIEQTLPDIEERANELLDRLTDGRMHVRLETLRDKKSGGTKETLDIIITDEQGVPRPYETFSGGEAFRVNFALRIALAQLLAERSGVRVRTLVIDEGFGTQDDQGVENLVQAIQTIQDDFDRILVITHLDQLKEAFPVRIEVEKDPVEGSRFQLIGV